MQRWPVTLLIFILTLGLVPEACWGMTDAERELLVEKFKTMRDLNDVGSKPISELLNDPHYDSFFTNYSRALKVVELSDKIASANDMQAFQLVAGEAADYTLAQYAPAVSRGLSWFGAIKTGMELFKGFVFDPWLQEQTAETYIARREEGLEPADAFATVHSWGHIREWALKQLEKSGYNMKLLWVNGEKGKLSPVWERKLEHFAMANYEAQYQKKLWRAARARAERDAAADKVRLKKLLASMQKTSDSSGLAGVWEGTSGDPRYQVELTIHGQTGSQKVLEHGKAVGSTTLTFTRHDGDRFYFTEVITPPPGARWASSNEGYAQVEGDTLHLTYTLHTTSATLKRKHKSR